MIRYDRADKDRDVFRKIQPIELIGSRLRDRIYVVTEAANSNMYLLYTLNINIKLVE